MNTPYKDVILDHYRNPRNFGPLAGATHSAEFENISCGDKIRMQAHVESGILKEVRFQGDGCAISKASASLITQDMKEKHVSFVNNSDTAYIFGLLGIELSPLRAKCALLALMALRNAVNEKVE